MQPAETSAPSEELDKLLQALAAGADVASGSRYLAASLATRPQPFASYFGPLYIPCCP